MPLPLLFLFLFHSSLAVTDTYRDLASSLFSEDLFLTHLSSDFIDRNVNPCDNFYRHTCPRDFVQAEEMFEKTKSQVEAIDKIRSFMNARRVSHTIPRLRTGWDLDKLNYEDEQLVFRVLRNCHSFFGSGHGGWSDKVNSAATLFALFKDVVIIHDNEKPIDMTKPLIMDEYKLSGRVTEETIARNITMAATYLAELINATADKFHLVNDFISNYSIKLEDEITVLDLVEREGMDHEGAKARIAALIKSFMEVYHEKIEKATWGSREDRFGVTRRYILESYLTNITFAVFFSKEYSLKAGFQRAVLEKFNAAFVEEYRSMSELRQLPRLRLLHAAMHAFAVSLRDRPDSDLVEFRLVSSSFRIPEISAGSTQSGRWSLRANQLVTIHAAFTAPTPALYGFVGVIFAHEVYHHNQFAHEEYIEDNSEHEAARGCVFCHFDRVCSRFSETTCASGNQTWMEDTADIYGVQITYEAFLRSIGDEIDDIVYPELNITNRELFFYSLAISSCNRFKASQWRTIVVENVGVIKDDHNGFLYRVNGMIGQLPEATRTSFQCYDDDMLTFPQSGRCPAFSDDLA